MKAIVKPFGTLAVLALGALTTGASGAHASTEWRGGGYVSDFVGCEEYGWTDTQRVLSRLRPDGMPGNSDTHSRLSLMFSSGQMNFFVPSDADIRFNFAEIDAASAFTAITIHTNPRVQLKLTRGSTVFTMDENTPLVEIYGEIQNFDGLAGCSARFGLSLAKR